MRSHTFSLYLTNTLTGKIHPLLSFSLWVKDTASQKIEHKFAGNQPKQYTGVTTFINNPAEKYLQ